MLHEKMRSPGTYNAISSAIAAGKNQNNDIAQAVDLLASSLTSCLSNLIDIRTVDQWWGNNPIKHREEETES
ncbi:hypothetical protein [Lactobacillus delbrueckii]